MSANPLLEQLKTQNFKPPFNQIKEEHFLPALKLLINEAQKKLDAIKQKEASFENSIEALEVATEDIAWVQNIYFALLHAEATEKLESITAEFAQLTSDFYSKIFLEEELFKKSKCCFIKTKTSSI